jgi:hypothetical protein
MATQCEEFEVKIEMAAHDALDAAETRALGAHLHECASCRHFAERTGALADALKHEVKQEQTRTDWSRLEGGIARLRRAHRLKLWLAPLFLLQLPVSFLLATGHLPSLLLLVTIPQGTVVIFLVYVWLVNRPFREVLAVARAREDLMRGYERELLRRQLRARIFAVVNAGLALAGIVAAFFQPTARLVFYALGCALLFLGWAAYDVLRNLPRLGRALSELR